MVKTNWCVVPYTKAASITALCSEKERGGEREERLVCVILFGILSYTLLCSTMFKEKSFVGIPVGNMQAVKEVIKSLFQSSQGKSRIKRELKMSYTCSYMTNL